MIEDGGFARFRRCDLHMHTPLEPNWDEEPLRLTFGDSEMRMREVAREYLKACHEAGLEVIGIVHHNFAPSPDASFIKWLVAENNDVARQMNREPLVVFPGFEMEADVGKGCHVLCLFPQDTPLPVVDARITALGLPPDERYANGQPRPSKKQLSDILEVVQAAGPYCGIVIAAHPMKDQGLFDDDRVAGWLQREEFTNEGLLCLEVPKPVEQMSAGWRRLLRGGADCDATWRRQRPIACIMSSDCHRLHKLESRPTNHAGSRFTWIKMSQPSVESLRQAFLDHQSRIRLGVGCPDERFVYPRIRRVSVRDGSFLRRLEDVRWSPNLNCLIGSRGTGKSTLVDYMRLALDQMRPSDLPESLRPEIEKRAKGTLRTGTRIEIDLETRGGLYRVVFVADGGPGRREVYAPNATEPDPQLDVRTLFPCRFLSQREIDHTVGERDRAAQRKFLDDFIRRDLSSLSQIEEDLKNKIRQVEATLTAKRDRQKRRSTIETERLDLQNQLQAQKHLTELLPLWQGVEVERDFFERLFRECDEVASTLRTRVNDLEIPSSGLTDELRRSPNTALVSEAATTVTRALEALAQGLRDAITEFENQTTAKDAPLSSLHQRRWRPRYDEVKQRFTEAQKGAAEQGLSLQAVQEIPQRILAWNAELSVLDREQQEINALEGQRSTNLAQLRNTWRQQTEVRQRKAAELMNKLRPEPGGKPYVQIQVEHQADREHVTGLLANKIHDRRRLNDDDIAGVVGYLMDDPNQDPAHTVMERLATEVKKGEASVVLKTKLQDRRRDAFLETLTEGVLRSLEIERVNDDIVYYVYRKDGTLAGPIDKVSAGQQGTAILNLLLAGGDEPLIVDTPEEGLDNEGVYLDLVPVFRREKEIRQIIVATHNANIPVNADAELIVALDAAGFVPIDALGGLVSNAGHQMENSHLLHLAELIRWPDWEARIRRYLERDRGWSATAIDQMVKGIGHARAAEGRVRMAEEAGHPATMARGALDAPAVKRAVQDIMEGSQEAFRRRTEKYGL
ncbi:MAG: AAA family ATPase [Bacillota bacterium]|nr:AAA family ATPase [Bacillota bacterium]